MSSPVEQGVWHSQSEPSERCTIPSYSLAGSRLLEWKSVALAVYVNFCLAATQLYGGGMGGVLGGGGGGGGDGEGNMTARVSPPGTPI